MVVLSFWSLRISDWLAGSGPRRRSSASARVRGYVISSSKKARCCLAMTGQLKTSFTRARPRAARSARRVGLSSKLASCSARPSRPFPEPQPPHP